jgi:UDP-2-acetamido-2-deoxy-ribo-hexuluronate aminotransferase
MGSEDCKRNKYASRSYYLIFFINIMKFIDLNLQHKIIESEIKIGIDKVLDHNQYIMGPEVRLLEEKLAEFVGSKNCIAVGSGTDAILISMMALNIGPGDEVITSPFSFIAAVEMILLLGAKPIYVDIDSTTFNIDASLIEEKITSNTKLIIPVSLFGQCPDMATINEVASRYSIPVLEDSAQSFGASYKAKKSCNLSTIGCTSFFPSKPLACYGDGGAIFTNDQCLTDVIKEIRTHGQKKRYFHHRLGINSRLDSIQAAILLEKIKIFPNEIILRQQVAERYNSLFSSFKDQIISPNISIFNKSVYAQYTIQTEERDSLKLFLEKNDIPTVIYYPIPLNEQSINKDFSKDLPNAKLASDRVLSLPMHPYLTKKDQDKVVNCCKVFFEKS